jgi:hypothetical protein
MVLWMLSFLCFKSCSEEVIWSDLPCFLAMSMPNELLNTFILSKADSNSAHGSRPIGELCLFAYLPDVSMAWIPAPVTRPCCPFATRFYINPQGESLHNTTLSKLSKVMAKSLKRLCARILGTTYVKDLKAAKRPSR